MTNLARLLLILLLLVSAMLACDFTDLINGDDGAADNTATGNTSDEALETLGAEQFHLQLTAVAEEENAIRTEP